MAAREGVQAWRGDACCAPTPNPALLFGGLMPVIALVLFALFAALGFGWRSWLQHRRTGSTGFRGVTGRPGSAEWFAGVGFVLAVRRRGRRANPAVGRDGRAGCGPARRWIQAAGIVLALLGIAGTVYAQLDMGDSWRIGVDPGERTTLVRSGVFGRVRNPIFTAMLTSAPASPS